MLRKFVSTAASRVLIAITNLVIVWIIARQMGAAAMGTVSLIILGVSIIQMVIAVFAGSSVVFQYTRHPLASLLIIAWSWIIVASVPVWLLLSSLSLIPGEFTLDVLILSILTGVFSLNQNIFLGKEKVGVFNFLAILQVLIILIVLSIMVLVHGSRDVRAYITAQYIGTGVISIIGTLMNFPQLKEFRLPKMLIIKEAAQFGGFLQAASFMQLFNYRLSYYIVEKFFDRATLGVFSLGVQIAESVWIISKSMAVIQYSRISATRDEMLPRKLTLDFFKITGVITIFLIVVIVLLPKEFYVLIFQSDFTSITMVILSLSPGIIAVALSLILSHYFSGTGQPRFNTISSGIGLILTLILGFTLIPTWGLIGAGITASASYFCSMLYQIIIFKNKTSMKWKSFLPNKQDLAFFSKELKTIYCR